MDILNVVKESEIKLQESSNSNDGNIQHGSETKVAANETIPEVAPKAKNNPELKQERDTKESKESNMESKYSIDSNKFHFISKNVNIKGFCVYWDRIPSTSPQMLSKTASQHEILHNLIRLASAVPCIELDSILNDDHTTFEAKYLVDPFDVSAILTINERHIEGMPQLSLQANIPQVILYYSITALFIDSSFLCLYCLVLFEIHETDL